MSSGTNMLFCDDIPVAVSVSPGGPVEKEDAKTRHACEGEKKFCDCQRIVAYKAVISQESVCFITAGPIAVGGGAEWRTCAYEKRRAEACVD